MRTSTARAEFGAAIRAGDVAAALAVVGAERERGASVTDVLLEVIGPAQADVGQLWQSTDLSVADEHAATAISEAVVHLLASSPPGAVEGRPPVVLTCADNEWHTIPALLVAAALRESGWKVVYLGASMPGEHLDGFLRANRPLALAVSCSLPLNLPSIRRQVVVAHALGIPVVAGGRAFDSAGVRAAALGVDATAGAGIDVDKLLREWLVEAPRLAEVKAGAEEVEANRIRGTRGAIAELAFGLLEQRFPGMAAYDQRQRTRTLEDLLHTLDFLATALDLGDRSLLSDYLAWLAELLGRRNVPAAVLGTSLNVLREALDASSSGGLWLAAAATPLGLHKVATEGPRVQNAESRGPSRDMAVVEVATRSEWERRAAITEGALATAEVVFAVGDPVTVAEVFVRSVAERLGLTTAVVGLSADGRPAAQAVFPDPAWTLQPPQAFEPVLATLKGGIPRAFRLAGKEGFAVPVQAGSAKPSTVLVALGSGGVAGVDTAFAVTVLAKVLGFALRAADLEKDNRAKQTFLSLISHELRTPLSFILGSAHLLELDGVELGENRLGHVRRILGGGARLLGVVNNVMDLVELADKPMSGGVEAFAVRSLLDDAVKAAAAIPSHPPVVVTCPADLALVTARMHLLRALSNVVVNAFQFSPAGTEVRLNAAAAPGAVEIQVSDSGPGMEPELVARLGNPLFQQSRGLTRSHYGMGLGLAAARAHLETIGARLSILSTLGVGTVVTISIPAAATATKES